jgi:hypothetical protein
MSDSVVPYLISGAFGLLGVLIGGGLQILAQHRSVREQRTRQQLDFRRSKLEELFGIAEQVNQGLITTYANALGRLKYGVKEFPTEKDKIEIPIKRMEMFVSFYFPELETSFERVKKIWKQAGNGVARSITVESITSHEIEEARALLSRCVPALHVAMENFVQGMSKIARESMRS